MARQNTFTVIPQAPCFDADAAAAAGPARPMTSKQVRKAYKAATKTPTMSRAERIKWEREEQERIKKDYEKERAAAKARAAREKKKEKEMQQREEKRRNGLPLVNVRPSQDTIARFVRGNGSNKKRDAEGIEVTKEASREEPGNQQDDTDATVLEADAAILGSILEAEEEPEENGTAIMPKNAADNESSATNIENPPPEDSIDRQPTTHEETTAEQGTGQGMSINSEDFDVDLSLEEPIDEAAFDAALDLVPAAEAAEGGEVTGSSKNAHDVEAGITEMEDDNKHAVQPAASFLPSQDLLDEDINTDMLEELDELLSGGKTPAKPPARQPPPAHIPATIPTKGTTTNIENIAKYEASTLRQERRKSPSQRRVQLPSSSPEQPRQAPPMGTQAILVDFDDFFPTSSQQLLELEEEHEPSQSESPSRPPAQNIEDTRSTTNIQPHIASKQSTVPKPDLELDELESDFGSFPSTAHFSLIDCSTTQQPPRQTAQVYTPAADTPAQPVSKPEPPRPAQPSQPPSNPSRFFTSSGSREQLSLALQRSRRSAALEQIQEKERQRQEAGLLMRQSKHDEAAAAERQLKWPVPPPAVEKKPGNKLPQHADKENRQPEVKWSQETEYGGDWVEDAAWDLALC